MHLLRAGAGKIVHELTKRGVVPDLGVHIYDMRLFAERCAGFPDCPVDVINRAAAAQYILLRDKNHIGFVQLLVLIAGFGDVGIDEAAVVAGAFYTCALVAALHLDVVDPPGGVNRQNVQTDRTPLQIPNVVLTVDTLHLQVCALQDDLQQEFGTGRILEHLVHEIVVQQAQTAKPL